ncbi:MAG: hypothetical protein LUH47_06905 [Clostridiales bacterium]|nr:hypothetical protein [Clostridiales bacterium]
MREYISIPEFIYLSLAVIAISVYSLSLGKEPFQMMFFFLLYAVLRSRFISNNMKFLSGVSVVILSSACFRTYYILIVIYAVVMFYLLKIYTGDGERRKAAELYDEDGYIQWRIIIRIFIALILVYFFVLLLFYVVRPSLYIRFRNSLVSASQQTRRSNSYIENILSINNRSQNVFTTWVEYIFVVFRLCFPVELAPLGPKYWPFIIYQCCCTWLMLKSLRRFQFNSAAQNSAMMLFVGFVFASASFEVDFGAWVRHCAVTLPMTLVMIGICPTYSDT